MSDLNLLKTAIDQGAIIQDATNTERVLLVGVQYEHYAIVEWGWYRELHWIPADIGERDWHIATPEDIAFFDVEKAIIEASIELCPPPSPTSYGKDFRFYHGS